MPFDVVGEDDGEPVCRQCRCRNGGSEPVLFLCFKRGFRGGATPVQGGGAEGAAFAVYVRCALCTPTTALLSTVAGRVVPEAKRGLMESAQQGNRQLLHGRTGEALRLT